jgi:hypothetical protein
VGLEGLGQLKNPATSLGIEPTTFWLIALCAEVSKTALSTLADRSIWASLAGLDNLARLTVIFLTLYVFLKWAWGRTGHL